MVPFDGQANGTEVRAVEKGSVIIKNLQPEVVGEPEIRAFPEGQRIDKNSYLQVVGDISDPDDPRENLFFVVKWYRNGEKIDLGLQLDRESNHLSSSYFGKGDEISAEFWPSDGITRGTKGPAANTNNVMNTLPVLEVVSPVDGAIYLLGQTVEFNAGTSYDLDGDELSFSWKINGEELSTVKVFE